jgi:hypothetical protein
VLFSFVFPPKFVCTWKESRKTALSVQHKHVAFCYNHIIAFMKNLFN